MFKRQDYFKFLKQGFPKHRFIVTEGESKCSTYGLLEARHLGGCTSCAILYEGDNRIGAVTDFRPLQGEKHLTEIKMLVANHPQLKDAQNVALFWDRRNRESRYHPNGNVHKLYSGIQKIFEDSFIEDIPYPGRLDWYGLNVDIGMLIIKW